MTGKSRHLAGQGRDGRKIVLYVEYVVAVAGES